MLSSNQQDDKDWFKDNDAGAFGLRIVGLWSTTVTQGQTVRGNEAHAAHASFPAWTRAFAFCGPASDPRRGEQAARNGDAHA